MSRPEIRVYVGSVIANEYANRVPDFIPERMFRPGVYWLTFGEAVAVLNDALHNSDRNAFDVGPDDMPRGVFAAYKRLATQIQERLIERRSSADGKSAALTGRLERGVRFVCGAIETA